MISPRPRPYIVRWRDRDDRVLLVLIGRVVSRSKRSYGAGFCGKARAELERARAAR